MSHITVSTCVCKPVSRRIALEGLRGPTILPLLSPTSTLRRPLKPCSASPESSSGAAPTSVAEAPATTASAASGTSKPSSGQRDLWVNSQHVRSLSVKEAEELYASLCERSNEQHVLLVLYAPWCQHCRAVEAEVEKLASGLGHERSLSVVALNGDTPASRYFARDVLGLQYMPSFVLFPRHSRTFYKYKGKARDAKSLLKFMNMVCNQSEDRVWQLGAAGAAEAVAAAAAAESSTVVAAVAPPAAAAAAASGSKLAQGGPGLGVVGSAVLGVAALALAGKVLLGGGGRKAGPEGDLVAEVDSSISRMAGLMVKLLGARVGLSVGKLAQAAGGASASSSPARTTTTIDVVSSSSSSNGNGNGAASSNGAGTKTAPAAAQPATKAAAAAGVTVGAARATVAAATFALPAVSDAAQGFSGSSSGSSLTADAAQLLEAVQGWQPLQQQQQPGYELGVVDVLVQEEEEERFARAPSPEEALEHLGVGHLPGQMLEAGLTGEAVRVTRRLDADEVLRLLEQEGADVNKVLDRLGSEGLLAVEQVDRR